MMDLEEKIDYFVDEVNVKVKNTMEEQMTAYQESLDKDLKDFKRKIDASFADRLESEKNAARKENNKAISKIRFNHQHELYVQEEKLKKSLYDKFENVLNEYKETDEYKEHMKKMIQSVQEYAQDELFDIYIDPSDEHLLSDLEEKTNAELNISNREFIGGVRGVARERGILLDFSFSTLLTRAEEDFSITEGLNR